MRASLPQNIADVERLLTDAGYSFVRQRGSHRHYRNARGKLQSFAISGGNKVNREYVDNLARRLRKEQAATATTTETRTPQTMPYPDQRVDAPDFEQHRINYPSNGSNGHIAKPAAAQPKHKPPLSLDTPEFRARVRAAYKPGMPFSQLASLLGVADMTAARYVRLLGLDSPAAPAPAATFTQTVPAASAAPATLAEALNLKLPPIAPAPQPAPVSSVLSAPRSGVLDMTFGEWLDMGGPSVFRAEHFTVFATSPNDSGVTAYQLFTEDSRGPGRALPQWMLNWSVGLMFCAKPSDAPSIAGRVHV